MDARKFDIADGKVILTAWQDVEPILESVKQRRSAGDIGSSEMRYAGEIPNVVCESYIALKGITPFEFYNNPVHIKSILNDPDFSELRVWMGKL